MTDPVPSPLSHRASTDPYLTVAEIAAAERVSTMTVYRLIWSGELPADRIGRSLRVRLSDFQAAVAGTAAGALHATLQRRHALGQALRAARTAAGWTQDELARKTGCSPYSVSCAEREGRGPRTFWQAADHALGMGGALAAQYGQTQPPA